MAHDGTPRPNPIALAAGFGIGVLWIAMALWCLISAVKGYADDRPDYGLIWSVVGILLMAGGISALIGTWWHQFALPRKHAHAQHH